MKLLPSAIRWLFEYEIPYKILSNIHKSPENLDKKLRGIASDTEVVGIYGFFLSWNEIEVCEMAFLYHGREGQLEQY